eukprot:c27338_g2_i1 orf=437-1426(-)
MGATCVIQELPSHMCKEVAMEQCSQNNVESLKQTMLKHEAMFREQVRELHRLYQVQRLMMAEAKRKDFAILGYSAVPSSSKDSFSCSFSYNSIKLALETRLWHASNEPLNVSRCDQKDLILKTDQGFPTTPLENNLSHDVVNCEHSVRRSIKAERRIFDLERPAEDYMDDELEENLQEECTLRMGVKQSGPEFWSKLANGIPERGNKVYLSLGTGCDSNVDVPPTNNRAVSLEECIRGEKGLLKCPRSSEGISFFPMASSMRNEGLSQEAPFCPKPILSGKRHLGVLLGLNQESWQDSVSMPDMLKRDTKDEGKRRGSHLTLKLVIGPH